MCLGALWRREATDISGSLEGQDYCQSHDYDSVNPSWQLLVEDLHLEAEDWAP